MITNTSEYLRGMRDCEQGLPHKSGQSEDYDRGYAAQYEAEQVMGAFDDE